MPRFIAASIVIVVIVTFTAGGAAGADEGRSRLRTVPAVDLSRYVGLWYEIAKIPNRFQKQCTGGTTAEYTLRPDGRITVLNSCDTADGTRDSAEGLARVVAGSDGARLQVSFFSILGWRPVWGDYWVIGLDPDYRWAVVGSPGRKYGWILARTPQLPDEEMAAIWDIIERNGYRRDAFEMSPQP